MFYAFESKGSFAVRVTSVFNTLLQLPGVWVTTVAFHGDRVEVGVRLRRRKLVCPHCGWATHARFDTRPADSWWRGLDLGVWKVHIRARLRRLHCRACDRVSTEQVPFARHGARFTRDVEDLVAWLAQRGCQMVCVGAATRQHEAIRLGRSSHDTDDRYVVWQRPRV